MARSIARQTLSISSVESASTVQSTVADAQRTGDVRIEDIMPESVLSVKLGPESVLAVKLGQASVTSPKLADSLIMPGNVTQPSQTSFLTRKNLRGIGVFGTGGNNDHTGDENPFPFTDGADYNTGGGFNAATGVFTALVGGKYFFACGLELLGAGGTPAGSFNIYLLINAVQFPLGYVLSGLMTPASIILPMVAGDTAKIFVDVLGASTWEDSVNQVGWFTGTLLS